MSHPTRQEREKLPKTSGISITWKHSKYTMGQVVRDWFTKAVSVRNHTYHDGSVFVQLLNEKGQIVSSFEPSTISNIEYHTGAAS